MSYELTRLLGQDATRLAEEARRDLNWRLPSQANLLDYILETTEEQAARDAEYSEYLWTEVLGPYGLEWQRERGGW